MDSPTFVSLSTRQLLSCVCGPYCLGVSGAPGAPLLESWEYVSNDYAQEVVSDGQMGWAFSMGSCYMFERYHMLVFS